MGLKPPTRIIGNLDGRVAQVETIPPGIFSVGPFFLLSGCETFTKNDATTVGSHKLATDPSFYRSLRTTGGRGGDPEGS